MSTSEMIEKGESIMGKEEQQFLWCNSFEQFGKRTQRVQGDKRRIESSEPETILFVGHPDGHMDEGLIRELDEKASLTKAELALTNLDLLAVEMVPWIAHFDGGRIMGSM